MLGSCTGVQLLTKAVAILGVVRFLGAYSLVVVVRRRRVGVVGSHRIYSVQDYDLLPISNMPSSDSFLPWKWLRGFNRETQVSRVHACECACSRDAWSLLVPCNG